MFPHPQKSLRLLTVLTSYLHLHHVTFHTVPFSPLPLSHFSPLVKPVSQLLFHLFTFNIFHAPFPFCTVYQEVHKKELMPTKELLTATGIKHCSETRLPSKNPPTLFSCLSI